MFAFINRNRSDLCKALAASLTVPLTFCCSAFVVYFGNKHDFFLQATDFLTPFFFVTVVVSSVLFLVQLPFVGRKYFNGVNIAVFTLAFFMWCQGNLFNLGYGSVFLNEIFFGIFHWANWEHFLYFFLVVLIVVYRRAISKYMLSLSALLV